MMQFISTCDSNKRKQKVAFISVELTPQNGYGLGINYPENLIKLIPKRRRGVNTVTQMAVQSSIYSSGLRLQAFLNPVDGKWKDFVYLFLPADASGRLIRT